MKICFPTEHATGVNSAVFNHFGSAPSFVVIDTDTNEVGVINNRDIHHVHGACNPMNALSGAKVDAIVVGGIGAGALSKLNQLGISVYKAMAPTVAENLSLLKRDSLPVLTLQQCCGGHSDGGCAHHN
ncbi:MAG TPA: NifB/NifX family molybdenum-iron cluster-binding protein [Dissulfurispiraceae bacterium]|nr:NifB/NifX family molybdenum-iron cluster-binding protein [Dissulfurispiraceae bacterium]